MIDAGTAFNRPHEDFFITDAELVALSRWELDALNELMKPNNFQPFKIECWKQMDPPASIIRFTYPVPDITSLERYDYEPDHGEPMDRASRAAESYRAANTPAPEARFLRWL